MEDVERIVKYVFDNPKEFSSYYLIKHNISSNTVHKVRNAETTVDDLSWKTIKKILICYNNKVNA